MNDSVDAEVVVLAEDAQLPLPVRPHGDRKRIRLLHPCSNHLVVVECCQALALPLLRVWHSEQGTSIHTVAVTNFTKDISVADNFCLCVFTGLLLPTVPLELRLVP